MSEEIKNETIASQHEQLRLRTRLKKLIILKDTAITLLVSTIILLLVRIIFCPIFVNGQSMEPTLKNKQLVLCTKKFQTLEKGDIVVFKAAIQVIKRVVATAGDTVYIKDGILYVNESPSPYQYESIQEAGVLSSPLKVPDGHIVCMGDNRNHSVDSRMYGAVDIADVRYKVVKLVMATFSDGPSVKVEEINNKEGESK